MNKQLVGKIETAGKVLIVIEIIYNLFIKFFIDVLGFPYALNYVTDIFMVLAFLCACVVFVSKKEKINIRSELLILAAFFVCTIISGIINKKFSVMLYAWAVRNTFRFFAFWLSCIVLLNKDDVSRILKMVYHIFWIHVLVCTIQFFFFGINRDYLNGIFGITIGYNTYSNVLICVVAAYIIGMYIYKKVSIYEFVLTLLACGYVTGLAEIKIFMIEVAVLGVCAIAASLPKKKIASTALMCFISFVICTGLTLLIYPEYRHSMKNPAKFAEGYVTDGSYGELYVELDESEVEEIKKENINSPLYEEKEINGKKVYVMKHLNRVSGVKTIFKEFLNKPYKALFGLGMGNTQQSSIGAFNSEFSEKWGGTGYTRFSHIQMLLEHGIVGTLLYGLFFISIFIKAVLLKLKNYDEPLLPVAVAIVVCSAVFFIYDKSLQAEGSGYLLFMLFAIPCILYKEFVKGNS